MFLRRKSGWQSWMEYWAKHPNYTSLVHFLGGMGFAWVLVGFLPGQQLGGWGWILLLVAFVGHIYPILVKR